MLDTDDHEYGLLECMGLLKTDPEDAFNNADSYAWFRTLLHETENGRDIIKSTAFQNLRVNAPSSLLFL